MPLEDFIGGRRDELIRRWREKTATRSALPAGGGIDHGVSSFLDQLCKELRQERSNTTEISSSAMEHGHDLLLQGFTISQVVHIYGDICQSVGDLAVELAVPISTDDFRTMNRCLDDAIASAVSEYAHEQDVSRYGASRQLQSLTDTAITAFEALRIGEVGVTGNTAAVVHDSLMAIRAALVDRPFAPEITLGQEAKVHVPTSTA